MSFININAFAQQQLADIAAGHFDGALSQVSQMAYEVSSHPRAMSKVMASPELDDVCRAAGQAMLPQLSPRNADVDERPWLFIATYLYDQGGHTRVLEDYIKFSNGQKCVVLLTNLGNGDPVIHKGDLFTDAVEQLGATVRISTSGSMTDKLRWLQQTIVDLNPARTFLFTHFYDSVAVAAAQAIPTGTGYFLHHADYRFSLGVYTDCVQHIDFHPAGLCLCRDKLKVKNQVYWPFSASDDGVRGADSFFKNGRLTTASSGAPAKFAPPYPFNYFEFVPQIIAAVDGAHVHIGRLSDEQVAQIHHGLDARGLPRERFIHVPNVPSVWRALLEYGVDVYLPSFPVGGNKATLEAMGSGTPVISHLGMGDYRYMIGGDFMIYPQAPRWRNVAELGAALGLMQSPDNLQQHREHARAHYDAYFSETLSRHALNTASRELPALELPTFHPMDLQDFYFYEAYPVTAG
ncbi:MAG: glycosyltransferase [Formosimonas sp.]